ncbi:hypothetical protein BV20DRAFT_961915 [Pilatotrama ljubarskyi]|nr:hypothetical protein BV20DRAFT_961915 [Pilatotrama ljubarskyi]
MPILVMNGGSLRMIEELVESRSAVMLSEKSRTRYTFPPSDECSRMFHPSRHGEWSILVTVCPSFKGLGPIISASVDLYV